MNKNEKQSIRKYDSIASSYDTSLEGRYTKQFHNEMLKLCKVSKGDRVLDVGCGSGKLIHEISRRAEITAYGMDLSPNMVEVCKQLYEGISFFIASGEELPFDADSFDMLTISCALHHLNNPAKFFSEAQRVLVKGGVLLVGEPCFPLVIRKLTDWFFSPLLKSGDNKLFSHKRLKRLFTDNSFSIDEVYKQDFKQIIMGRNW